MVAGRQNGYGNVVILQHAGAYSTVYAHLSRFAAGVEARRARRPGRIDRLRRPDRLGDRPASALRVPRQQRAARPAHDRAAGCAADGRGRPARVCRSASRPLPTQLVARTRSPSLAGADSCQQRILGSSALRRAHVRHQRRRRRCACSPISPLRPGEPCAHAHVAFDAALRAELDASATQSGADELHRSALAANALMDCCAAAVSALLTAAGLEPSQIAAIGVHGQTVRHRPDSGLHDAARQSGAAGRGDRHHRRRRFSQPRRRRGRAGRAAGTGIARSAVPARRPASRGRQYRRHRQHHRPAAREGRYAASTPARATRCSMRGACGTPARRSIATAHGRRVATSIAALLDALQADPYFARHRRRARGATTSTCAGWSAIDRRRWRRRTCSER